MELGFGQPGNGIIQMAFVVPDLDEAMETYSQRFGVGPWTVLRDFAAEGARYRDEPARSLAHLAMGFGGHMQYELIQPADDLPSMHRETIQKRGYGFHHFGVAAEDFDGATAAYIALGYDPIFTAEVRPGFRVAYFDTQDILPGMVELMEAGRGMNEMFTPQYLAARSAT